MATESALARVESHTGSHSHGRKRALIGLTLAVLVVLAAAAAAAVSLFSGFSLAGDSTALARVSVEPFGGSIEHVEALGPGGRPIPIAVHHGRLTPLSRSGANP